MINAENDRGPAATDAGDAHAEQPRPVRVAVSELLAGGRRRSSSIALAAFTGALTGLIAYMSNDRELRDLTLWSMGSLGGASWTKVIAVLPFAALTLLVTPRLVRALNGFLLGEAEAFHLLGAAMVLLADVAARMLVRPAEVPICTW